MCSPTASFTQHMASFWRVTQRTLLQNRVQLFVAKTLKFILAIEIVLYEALTFKLQPTDSWVEHFFITYEEKLLLTQAVVMLWSSHRTSDQGDVGSNPAWGNNSSSSEVVQCWVSLNLIYIWLDLQKATSQCWDNYYNCRTKGLLLAAMIGAKIKVYPSLNNATCRLPSCLTAD